MEARERLETLDAVVAASRRQILLTVHFRKGMSAGDIAEEPEAGRER